ncbi:HNH endonuclease [Saccharothrix sp. AJ9571]|nr:HNH endonuclease [Saccharothrix sp. AJ9571]
MPWLRLDDVDYDDPQVDAVGNGAYGALVRLKLYCSAQRTDGWVPDRKARDIASRAELRALLDTRLGDRPAMLHRPGDDCRCLDGKTWPMAGGYWVHAFLDRNPSRAENDVQRAKNRELRDKELRRAVKDRDGDRCRYCGITVKWADRKTTAGGVLDHVDPRIAAGAANLVVACRGCNGQKKDCTPAAAGMVLLPPPDGTESITAGSSPDQPPIHGRSTEPPGDQSGSGSRSEVDAAPHPSAAKRAPERPQPDANTQVATQSSTTHDATTGGMTTGTGRGGNGTGTALETGYKHLIGDAGPTGYRPQVGPATTPRGYLDPNPYTRNPNPLPEPQPEAVEQDVAEAVSRP